MTLTGRGLFSLLIAVLMVFMVIASMDYGFKARLFPTSLGIIIFIMAVLQFLGDTFPDVKKRLRFLGQKGVALDGKNNSHAGQSDKKESGTANDVVSWPTIYGIFICLLMFAVLMYFTSFLIAVPVFLLLFVWLVGKEKFFPALGISVGTLIFMYILFKLILKSTF